MWRSAPVTICALVLLLAPVSAGSDAVVVGRDFVVADARRQRTDLVLGVAVLALCVLAVAASLMLRVVAV